MTTLLYIGKFLSWKDSNEDDVIDALTKFDNVKICVMIVGKTNKLKKGQPTKVVDKEFKNRLSICRFKHMKGLLNNNKDKRYILFAK